MRKVLLLTVAGLLSLVPVTFSSHDAQARIGRPGTPFSFAGVHRRAVRRTFGVGANLGWRGVYHRRVAWHRWHRPLLGAAVVGAAAYGASYGGGCDCGAPAPAADWGGPMNTYYNAGWGNPGVGAWGSGFGFRPGFGFGAPGFGWHRGWW